jgi:hypothetical protein
MSLIGITSLYPYSLTGIQDITGTVNGSTPIVSISIAGQTFYLSASSPDVNGNVVLTLNIITASTGNTGLLSSTDWNTFNGKESVLTFTSPLRRIGDVIDFDFSTSNTFSGVNTFSNLVNFNGNIQFNALPNATTPSALYIDGTGLVSYGASSNLLPLNNVWTGTQTYSNNIYYTSGSYFYTGLPNATSINALYVDPITGEMSYGAPFNLLPLNNVWTGTNTFDELVRVRDAFIVENANSLGLVMTIFRDKTNFPADYLAFSSSGNLSLTAVGYNGWLIDKNGHTEFNDTTTISIEVIGGGVVPMIVYRDKLNYPGDYLFYNSLGKIGHSVSNISRWVILDDGDATFTTLILRSRFGFVGNVLKMERDVTAPSDFIYFDNLGTFGYNNGWNIQAGGGGVMTMPVIQTTYIKCTNNTFRNFFKFTHFEPSPPTFSNWISAEFAYDAIDKPIIGNLGLAVGGYGPCFGAHDTTLGAWRDCWINPFATTYTGNLNATAFNYPSDRRIKKEISYLDASKSIKFVKGLKPAKFKKCVDDRIEFLKNEGEKFELGFIAQDIQEIAETESQKMIITTETYLEKERLTIKPFYILAELVNANKEMIDKIETLESDNTLLKQENDRLKQNYNLLLERMSIIEEKLLRNKTILKY